MTRQSKSVALCSVRLQTIHLDAWPTGKQNEVQNSKRYSERPHVTLLRWQRHRPHHYQHFCRYGLDKVPCVHLHISYHQWAPLYTPISLYGCCAHTGKPRNDEWRVWNISSTYCLPLVFFKPWGQWRFSSCRAQQQPACPCRHLQRWCILL